MAARAGQRARESFLDEGAGFVSSRHDLLPHKWSELKSPVGGGAAKPPDSVKSKSSP